MPVLFTIQDDAQDIVPQSPQLFLDDVSTDPTMLPGPNNAPAVYPTPAQSMHMSRRQKQYVFRSAMGEATFDMATTPPPIIRGWDLDSEQQLNVRLSPIPSVTDHLLDEGVELITLPPLAEIETEEVASNQIPRPEYYKDHLADENVEKITANPSLTSIIFWDNDAENQIPTLPLVSNLASDSGQDTTNFIILPLIAHDYELNQIRNDPNYADMHSDIGQDWTQFVIIPAFNAALVTHDADVEQFSTDRTYIDIEDERKGIPYIVLPFNDFSTDAENQLWNFAWTVDYQGWEYNDLLKEIVPTIFPVLIFYKLTSKPMLTIGELISTATEMSVTSVKNVAGLSFSSIYNELAG